MKIIYLALAGALTSLHAHAQADSSATPIAGREQDTLMPPTPAADTVPTQETLKITARATSATTPGTVAPNTDTFHVKASDTLIRYRINGTYFLSMWQDLKYTVSRPAHWQSKDFIRLGIVAGGAATLMGFDYEIKQVFLHNQQPFWTTFTNQVAPFGNQYSPYLLGGMYAAGLISGNRNLEHASLMGAKSLIISTLIYTSIKSVVRRGRPTYYDNPFYYNPPFTTDKYHTSFPSGHMMTVTTVATALAELYGQDHPWVPFVTYGVAILTGSARLYENRHWSSDVWLGASLGYFVTKSVFKHHRSLEHKKALLLEQSKLQ